MPITIDSSLVAALRTMAGARVWFGHQSVGGNILDGIAALAEEAGVPFRVEDAAIGANGQPVAKFEDFARRAERDPADGLQLMAMKLCYVDLPPETDVAALLVAYRGAVERARKARPGLRILHVTPPLTVRPTGLKTGLRRLIGSSVWGDQCNLRRLEFAEGLRRMFTADPIFDLAAAESTAPTGVREQHPVGGRTVPALWGGYTDDGGHLNETGKRVVARAFVQALAAALTKQTHEA
ncbi:MAG: hypothetical protein U1E73_07390 [Planctomycetota bacterium]